MGERPLVVSPWYLPSDEEYENCAALEPAQLETAPGTEDLCHDCANFNLSAALLDPKISLSNSVLWLGPFDHRIEQTSCPLCQTARQTIGQQDSDPDVKIRIKSFDAGALSVARVRKSEVIHGGYLSSGPLEMNQPFASSHIEYETAIQPWLPSVRFLQPSLEWFTTYTESQAQQQCLEWLSRCNIHDHLTYDHPMCASRSAAKSIRQGHLIDVHNMCIVDAGSTVEAPYFALSYVCGGIETLELTTTNEASLSIHGSLLQYDLPHTYNDGMRLTNNLGAQYLWIDTLCILHDALGPRQDQIESMDHIYGDAALVLVASVGTNPHFGLFPRSLKPKTIHGEFLHIDRRASVEREGSEISDYGSQDIAGTKYSTRMWCFQEQHLSTRRVVFGTHWLVFDCCEAQWISRANDAGQMIPVQSVGSNFDAEAMRLLRRGASASHESFDGRQFDAYAQLSGSYTRSELSYAEDVERAFAGFASIISRRQTQTVAHNIPMAMLPHALLWTPDDRFVYRSRTKKDVFPTWSWACTSDAISYPIVSSLMFSSQGPPRSHLHQSLVRALRLQSDSIVETFKVSSIIHRNAQAAECASLLQRAELKVADEQQPSKQFTVLQFSAYTVSTTNFLTKHLRPPTPRPEDWDGVAATQRLYTADTEGVTTQAVGTVWGLAEGHHCIPTPEQSVLEDRYSLVALLVVNHERASPPSSPTYFCIVVCHDGGVSRRVGMVSITEAAFEEAQPEWKVCQLV